MTAARKLQTGFVEADIVTADEVHEALGYRPDTDLVIISMEHSDPVALTPGTARELARAILEYAAQAERLKS